jgi:hypothetical protein
MFPGSKVGVCEGEKKAVVIEVENDLFLSLSSLGAEATVCLQVISTKVAEHQSCKANVQELVW